MALTGTDDLRVSDEVDLPPVPLWPATGWYRLPADEPIDDTILPRNLETGLMSMLGATWVLMSQPAVATTTPVRAPAVGRNHQHRPAREVEVTLVDLRAAPATHHDADGAGRTYQHRWYVRGHWRNQPYGPGQSMRRPTWVVSYVKGPPDAPLLVTEHVNVWRR